MLITLYNSHCHHLRVLLGRPGCIVMIQDLPDGLMVGKSPTFGNCLN